MTPFKIKRLYLENYKLFHSTEIEFGDSLTIFGGPNGYGKTSVFDAVELLIMGSISRVADNEAVSGTTAFSTNFLAGDSKKNVYIKGEFVAGDEHLVLAKRITPLGKNSNLNNPKKLGDQAKTYQLPQYDCATEAWDEYEINPQEVQHLLGIGSTQEFHLAHYIQQENRLAYFNKSEDGRTKFIQQLFGVEQEIEFSKRISDARKQLSAIRKKQEEEIHQLKANLESCTQSHVEDKVYERLFPDAQVAWDQPSLPFTGKASENIYSAMAKQIRNLLEFLQKKDQFLFAWPVDKFCKLNREMQQSHILAYAYLMKFGEASLAASAQRQQLLDHLTKQIKLVAEQKYLDIDYKGLTELLHKPASLARFTALCERAHQIQKNQSDLQKATSRIMEIRTQLCNFAEGANEIDGICPYCGQEWETREALTQQFHETTERLSQIFGRESTAFDDVLKELQILFEEELKKPLEQKMYELNSDLALQIFIEYPSANEIKVRARLVQQLLHAVKMDGLSFEWGNTREECLSEAAKHISSILVYSNQITPDYLEAAGIYDFDGTFEDYFHCDPNRITIVPNQVQNKLLYVQQAYYRSFDSDRERLRVLEKNTTELSVLYQQLHAYEKAYADALKEYRETIISQIEIPFFLYTSRILQSYQGGQGILIQSNGKNIRFVSPGSEHDVLYTMSSGQLSAILMAFFLAINKIYSAERFQTLLIDDPIQCMDDINMISLIEVLRSDFSDMQIILSTHEDQFANYIAYKYEKYNLPKKGISLKDVHMDETQVHL